MRLTYHTSANDAQSLVRELGALGCRAQADMLDLGDIASVSAYSDRLCRDLPRLDVLVHNASVYEPSPLDTLNEDELLQHYKVNTIAPLLLTRGVLSLLRASTMVGGASIVAMCDIHAMGRPRKGFYAYAMSKAALVEMVRGLALELAPDIRVNGVAPGVVAFPESGYESDAAMQERYLKRVPLGRSGTPEDAANAVKWLALEATYTTGEIVRVDGGRWLT